MQLGYRFIDSGSMYRAFTLFVIRKGINPTDQLSVANCIHQAEISFEWNETSHRYEIHLNGHNVEAEIRNMEVASAVSEVARISEVRSYMVAQQRAMAWEKGVVMDGRDIGTVVLKDAELKIFMTASPEVRAKRRFKELSAINADISFEQVLENLKKRDLIDSSREDSPLKMTNDYKVLDNSDLNIDQQNEIALRWVAEAMRS